MGDGLSILGGLLFLILAGLCRFRPDLVWRLYSLEPRWRKENPERTDTWDRKTQRSAIYYVFVGLAFIGFGLLL